MGYNVRTKKYRKHTETTVYEIPVIGTTRKHTEQTKRGEGDTDRSIAESIRRSRAQFYDIVHSNKWEWFVTNTFKPKIDRYDYDVVSAKMSKWLNNLKQRYCPDMLYVLSPDLHEDGAFHFHGLFSGIEGVRLIDSGKTWRGGKIYNLGRYSWGWSTATRVQDTEKAANYILQYMTPELMAVTFNRQRFWRSKKCATPEVQTQFLGAEGVALLRDTLADCIENITDWKTLCSQWGFSQIQVMDIYRYENIKQG